jgi:simple sugar transport system permease protein
MDRARLERYLDRLVDATVLERLAISLAAIAVAAVVGGAIVFLSGAVATCRDPALALGGSGLCYDPIEVYLTLLTGAFGSPTNLGLTLQETTLLLFTGLSVAVAFRAGLFNIGTQGQMVLGALGSAVFVLWVAPLVPASIFGTLVVVPLAVLVGAVVGGLYGAIPGAMKAYADAHEVITTIMLNFVAMGVAFYLVRNHLATPRRTPSRPRRSPSSSASRRPSAGPASRSSRSCSRSPWRPWSTCSTSGPSSGTTSGRAASHQRPPSTAASTPSATSSPA